MAKDLTLDFEMGSHSDAEITLGKLSLRLSDILGRGLVESDRLEYKRGWNPEAVMHTMCAYANDFDNIDGGYIVIGIDTTDAGEPLQPPFGVPEAELDGIGRKLTELGYKITPPYHPVCETCHIEGKTVLILKCSGGQNRPYKAPVSMSEKHREMAYYIRRNSCTVRVTTQQDEMELVNLANKIPHDDRLNQGAKVDDLERRLLIEHLERVGSDSASVAATMSIEELGLSLNIVRGATEARLPVNVGLMFFTTRPERFFPQTQIDVVQFPDGVGGDRIIEKTFLGPIGKQLTDALAYLQNSVLETMTIKREGRAESKKVWNYPYAALEEILPNAVYHRSYEVREPIEVRVEPHQITVVSHPGPDRSISMDDLRAGRLSWRRYRNRRIGEFLKELELTEGRSTGIPKVIRAMQFNGSPMPDFQTNEERDYFIATLPVHPAFLGRTLDGDLDGQPSKVPTKVPTWSQWSNVVSFRTLSRVQVRENEILEMCKQPQSRQDIQDAFDMKHARNLRQQYLQPLIERELLERTLPEKPTSQLQKYQTTAKGVEHLESYMRGNVSS